MHIFPRRISTFFFALLLILSIPLSSPYHWSGTILTFIWDFLTFTRQFPLWFRIKYIWFFNSWSNRLAAHTLRHPRIESFLLWWVLYSRRLLHPRRCRNIRDNPLLRAIFLQNLHRLAYSQPSQYKSDSLRCWLLGRNDRWWSFWNRYRQQQHLRVQDERFWPHMGQYEPLRSFQLQGFPAFSGLFIVPSYSKYPFIQNDYLLRWVFLQWIARISRYWNGFYHYSCALFHNLRYQSCSFVLKAMSLYKPQHVHVPP